MGKINLNYSITKALLLLVCMVTAQLSLAETLYLYKDCNDAPTGTQCYSTVAEIQNKLWGVIGFYPLLVTPTENVTINPGASNRVVVVIGPGEFTGQLSCSAYDGTNQGYVSFRGHGAGTSTLTYGAGYFSSTVTSSACGNLSFEDLSITNTGSGHYASPAFLWGQAIGNNSWMNVTLASENSIAWQEDSNYSGGIHDDCRSVVTSVESSHRIFSSRLMGAKAVVVSGCGEVGIYGSDLVLTTNPGSGIYIASEASQSVTAAYNDGVLNIYGSTLRADLSSGVPAGLSSVTGIYLGAIFGRGEVHMHGGIVNVVTASQSGIDSIGVNASDENSIAHTLSTPFIVRSNANAQSARLKGVGEVMSAQQWQAGTQAPEEGGAFGTFSSLDGQDMYVETDCNASGCSAGGADANKPHLMVYSEACGNEASSPWFDTVTKQCRQ